jgi:hypothetical protein
MFPLLLHEAWTMTRRALDSAACSECGRPTDGGYKLCERCRKLRRAWTAKRRRALRGKCCVVCKGKLAKTSDNLCAAHLAEQRAKKHAAYARRRRHRACPRCGAPALAGKALCSAHAAAQSGTKTKPERGRLQHCKTHPNANAREVVIRT